MVVEDEALILCDICDLLSGAGHRVLTDAACLSEAELAYESVQPEVAVLDINIGDDLIWEFARRLRTDGVALVFVSANLDHAELRGEFAQAQQVDKPVAASSLLAAVARASNDLRVTT